MLKVYRPLNYDHLLVSNSETESDDLEDHSTKARRKKMKQKKVKRRYDKSKNNNNKEANDEEQGKQGATSEKESVVKDAEKYQEYMKQIPIPTASDSPIPFVTWRGLVDSMKKKYEQPLHYLTQRLVEQWDVQSRFGIETEQKYSAEFIQPSKAEATIWVIEEVNRKCTSHHFLAELWLEDLRYRDYIDPIIPKND